MKKLLLFSLTALGLIGCTLSLPRTIEKQTLPPLESIVSSEITAPDIPTKNPVVKAIPPEKITTSPKVTASVPQNQSADEMTKELDSMIEAIVSGK